MPSKKHYSKLFASTFFLALFLLSSCATVETVGQEIKENTTEILFPKDGRLDYSVENGATIYIDAKKYLSDIIVNVGANRPLEAKPTALFVPLGMLQENFDHVAISKGVSRILWQQLLGEQTFKILEFSSINPPYMVENVVQGAKMLGADFVIGGYITYYLDGGGVGDSKIGLQWEIYDTNTGALLWSIQQSGLLPYKTDKENVIFTVHYRMPINSMSSLIAAMGAEIAVYLHHWTEPKLMEERQDAEKNKLFEPRAFGKY